MCPRNAAREYSPERPRLKPEEAEITRLVETNLPYAHAIAAEVIRKLPFDLERKDIRSWAELGLVEATNSFDPTLGVQFKTFAYYRIKGAIYDGLRKMGWYSKGQYQQLRFEMAANEYMRDFSEQRPGAASPEPQLQNLKDVTASVVSCYMLSLEGIAHDPVDQGQVSAEEVVLRKQQTDNLKLSLKRLPERNRRVLESFYFEGLTLEEIGRRLGLSKSWVCRLHAKSLEILRKFLTEKTGLVAAAEAPATFSKNFR